MPCNLKKIEGKIFLQIFFGPRGSLVPPKMHFRIFCKKSLLNTYFYPSIQKEVLYISSTLQLQ